MIATQIVNDAIAEINAADTKSSIPLMPGTCLYGENGHLDSIKLLWLISLIEAKVEERTHGSVTLSDEKAFSQRNSPFRSIATLVEYLEQRAAEAHLVLA